MEADLSITQDELKIAHSKTSRSSFCPSVLKESRIATTCKRSPSLVLDVSHFLHVFVRRLQMLVGVGAVNRLEWNVQKQWLQTANRICLSARTKIACVPHFRKTPSQKAKTPTSSIKKEGTLT